MQLKSDKLYKILHKPTGLYKAGGHNSKFNKTGKIWRGGTLKNHLRMFQRYRSLDPLYIQIAKHWGVDLKDCLVIEYDLCESNCDILKDFVNEEMT
jgi:putative alpha-1,2-mannosidase